MRRLGRLCKHCLLLLLDSTIFRDIGYLPLKWSLPLDCSLDDICHFFAIQLSLASTETAILRPVYCTEKYNTPLKMSKRKVKTPVGSESFRKCFLEDMEKRGIKESKARKEEYWFQLKYKCRPIRKEYFSTTSTDRNNILVCLTWTFSLR
ncbi:hypothetical protein M501DRAFT_999681 [Patellaria atrata CBS 101060]|uniref:Uncharacterized protein n=1 Tax=Patellaria atrata CBS 101060 TaxID=1346257 RepID=A0A9P4VJ82_9PEZI|nr:hypothetical protein M501DRAFT_999681 [Patellaria atrata CBS 101060]